MSGYLVVQAVKILFLLLGIYFHFAYVFAAIAYGYLWFCTFSLYMHTGKTEITPIEDVEITSL